MRSPRPSAAPLLLALLAGACSRSDGPRNLLLITFDTTRADRLGAYGGAADVSPNFDALARDGALFETAFTPAPRTLPAHASLLTGLEPPGHGIHANGEVLPADVTTLAQVLAAAGFATGAAVGSEVLDGRLGLARGFEFYDEIQGGPGVAPERRGDEVAAAARAWIERSDPGRRFFFWAHFFDPHDPYEPPPSFAGRFRGREYEGEIAFADAQLGSLLEALQSAGRLDDTLVCVTADHGESLGDHGEALHGYFVYDATTRVPLAMRHPATIERSRIAGVVRMVDVAPTLLDLLRVPHAPGGAGASLALFFGEAAVDPPRSAYLETDTLVPIGGAPLRAIRTDEWKFVRAPRPELYRLREDPGELTNLAEAQPELARKLDARLADIERRATSGRRAAEGDAETQRALAALGYAAPAVAGPSLLGLDPKDYLRLLDTAGAAAADAAAGREQDAVDRIEKDFAGKSERASATFYAAMRLHSSGQSPAARRWAARAIALRNDLAPARLLAAVLAFAAGEPAEAERVLRETLRVCPDFPEAKLHLGLLLLERGGGDEAEPLLRAFLVARPNSAAARAALDRLHPPAPPK